LIRLVVFEHRNVPRELDVSLTHENVIAQGDYSKTVDCFDGGFAVSTLFMAIASLLP
jgi:hypothetical protein